MIDFPGYLTRTREADDLPRAEVQKVEARCREGLGVADILERFGGELELPAVHVRRIHDAYRRFETVQRAAEPRRGRVPDEVLDEATATHQIEALDRAVGVVGADPLTLRAALGVWTRCLALARREGEAQIDVVAGHPGAAEFGEDARNKERLESLAAHRWLRWQRGERDGALRIRIELPLASIDAHARTALRPYLGPVDPRETIERVVLSELEGVLRRMLDDWAGADAIRSAQNVFQGVLRTPRLEADRIGSVHVGDGYGAAVFDRAGEVVEAIAADDLGQVAGLLDRHQVEVLVLPTRAPDTARLAQAQRRLGKGRRVQQVSPAGLGEARKGIAGPPSAASAVVLGRRAIDPIGEWTRIDPLRLGFAEYQQDLDEERLRAAYEEALRVVRAEARRPSLPRPQASAALASPLVRRIEDLRPGIMVQGVITSVTSFGAFVNLGLSDEGLIHVSELADRFVDDPSQVVTVGQPVLAKVLGIDRVRRRISLSLRREDRPARERGTSHGAKSQALSDLERLFKKG